MHMVLDYVDLAIPNSNDVLDIDELVAVLRQSSNGFPYGIVDAVNLVFHVAWMGSNPGAFSRARFSYHEPWRPIA